MLYQGPLFSETPFFQISSTPTDALEGTLEGTPEGHPENPIRLNSGIYIYIYALNSRGLNII